MEKYMDISGNSKDNGTPLIIFTLYSTDNQKFILTRLYNYVYQIIAKHSGKALQPVREDECADIVQYDVNNNSLLQRWVIKHEGNGWFSITNVATVRCMDVKGQETADCTHIIDYKNNGQDNQRFCFVKLD